MENWNAVEYIASKHIVEDLVRDYMIESEFKNDLIQEIYMILLDYNQEKLQNLIDKNQVRFFLAKIITNQYFSKTSPFFKKYKKPLLLKETLKPIIEQEEGDDESFD